MKLIPTMPEALFLCCLPVRQVVVNSLRFTVCACAFGAQISMAQDTPLPPTVGVMTVESGPVVLTATLPGRIIASAVAAVRPQVSGIIAERLFEGCARCQFTAGTGSGSLGERCE